MEGADLNTIGQLTLIYVCYLASYCQPLVHVGHSSSVLWSTDMPCAVCGCQIWQSPGPYLDAVKIMQQLPACRICALVVVRNFVVCLRSFSAV